MKKYLLVSFLTAFTLGAVAQLSAPVQTSPDNLATGVYVNETLTWNPSVGGVVTGYDCEIDVDSNFSNPVNLPVHGTGGLTNQLDFNQVYYWRVRAKNGTSTSPWSFVRSYTTFNDEFTNLNPKVMNRNPSLTLTWDTVSGSDSYTIEISTDPTYTTSKTYLIPRPVPDSAKDGFARLKLANLLFGATYYWRVRSNHGLDQSAFSASETFSVIASVNQITPPDLDIDKYARTAIICKNTNGVEEYRFQICDDPSFDQNSLYFHAPVAYRKDFPPKPNNTGGFDVQEIRVLAEFLSYGTKYYWRVQGVNNSAVSQWSATREFTTIDLVEDLSPADNAAGLGTKGIEFKWTKSDGAEGYIMEIDSSLSFDNPRFVETFGDTGNTVTLDVKKTSKNYFWRVKAIHFRDSTNWTATRSFYGTPVGVAAYSADYGFSIFPNPATDVVYFNLNSKDEGNAVIEIYSVLANRVDQLTVQKILGDKKIEYNTSKLQRGVYMVVVNLNGQKETHRLSIK